MEHPIVEGKHGDDNYFYHEAVLKSVWLGLVWLLAASYPAILYAAAQPWRDQWRYGYWWRYNWMTDGEWHAWRLIKIATGIEFGILILFWLLAYIKKPIM